MDISGFLSGLLAFGVIIIVVSIATLLIFAVIQSYKETFK